MDDELPRANAGEVIDMETNEVTKLDDHPPDMFAKDVAWGTEDVEAISDDDGGEDGGDQQVVASSSSMELAFRRDHKATKRKADGEATGGSVYKYGKKKRGNLRDGQERDIDII